MMGDDKRPVAAVLRDIYGPEATYVDTSNRGGDAFPTSAQKVTPQEVLKTALKPTGGIITPPGEPEPVLVLNRQQKRDFRKARERMARGR